VKGISPDGSPTGGEVFITLGKPDEEFRRAPTSQRPGTRRSVASTVPPSAGGIRARPSCSSSCSTRAWGAIAWIRHRAGNSSDATREDSRDEGGQDT
jgi:hypothetical protein